MAKKKTLKYYLDNKNFTKLAPKPSEKKGSVLRIEDDQIVINVDTPAYLEGDIVTSYTYMKNKGNRKKWTKEDVEFFYKALECCGLDFSVINLLFPERTRSNLKDKYKKEAKINACRVEDVLDSYKEFDIDKFNELKELIKHSDLER